MAKVKLSALVSDVRGKLNGSVFQGGPGGLSLRRQPATRHELTERQLQMFNLVASHTRNATQISTATLNAFGEEAQRNPKHSEFQSAFFTPRNNYYGLRFATSVGYGLSYVLYRNPNLVLPAPVINSALFANPYQLQLHYNTQSGLPIGTQIVIDVQFSRYQTGTFSDFKWRLFGWASPTPPTQYFNLQQPFVDSYTFHNRRAFVRLRLLLREQGLWSQAAISEVAIS